MTNKNFFIPTLTDVVDFADIVPVLTDRAEDDEHDGQVLVTPMPVPVPTSSLIKIDTPNAPMALLEDKNENTNQPTTTNQNPALASDTEALSQQLWVALEPEFKKILQQTVLTFFEQQQATLIDTLGAKIRPLLAQTLETHPMLHVLPTVNGVDKDTHPHSNNPSES